VSAQRRGHSRMDEFPDIPMQTGHFLDQRRGNEAVLFIGSQKDRLDLLDKVAIHRGELKLVLEIRHRAQPAQQHSGPFLADKMGEQNVEADHLDVFNAFLGKNQACKLDTLIEMEGRLLVRTLGNRDDETPEHAGRPGHEVGVSVGQGIESAGIDGKAVVGSLLHALGRALRDGLTLYRLTFPGPRGQQRQGHPALILASKGLEVRCLGRRFRALLLDIDEKARLHGPAGRQTLEGRCLKSPPERWIDEHDIDGFVRFRQPSKGIGVVDRHHLRSGPTLDGLIQATRERGVVLDEHHARCAARGRLEAERPGAGEQVHAARTDDTRSEPVEQRFACAVAGRTQAGSIGNLQFAPPPLPADDANPAGHGDSISAYPSQSSETCQAHRPMFSIFRRKKSGQGLESTRMRPTEKSGADPLEQRLERTRSSLSGLFGLVRGATAIDDELIEEIETTLLTSDLGVAATTRIIDRLREGIRQGIVSEPKQVLPAVQAELYDLIEPAEQFLAIDPARKPFVILMVGVNGVGKTTTIGKLARRYIDEGKSVMLAAGDTFRAAAVEQLKAWGERNGVPVMAQKSGADTAAVIYDALHSARSRGIDILIADTAGRLHTQGHLMDELAKVRRVMQKIDPEAPHETMLVVDAGTGQNALAQARQFNESVPLTGITVTKLDGTARGGVLFAIAHDLKIPIRFIGVGETAADLRPFDAGTFVHAVLPVGDA